MNRRVYLCGIGGIGMANLAALLKEAGYDISGSDHSVYEPAATVLRTADVHAYSPYAAENLPCDGTPVIIGNAHSRGHVEVEAALNAGLPLYSFPEFLGRFILSGRHSVVVAGTHGKSTTSAALAHILFNLGLDPGHLVGAMPCDYPTGARLGAPDSPFVVEGDEYDSAFFDKRSKFLHYFPRTLVLGPIEFDHADIFADEAEMLLAFKQLLRTVPANGRLLYCADSPHAVELAAIAPCPTISVGNTAGANWHLLKSAPELGFRSPAGREISVPCKLPGRHNRLNLLMALAAATEITDRLEEACESIPSFSGIRRRLQKIYEDDRWIVYDDFAHHPTAIAAALSTIRETYPDKRLIAVLEPRSNTMVRNLFQNQIADALSFADEVVVGTIHRAARIPLEQRLDLTRLQNALQSQSKKCAILETSAIPDFLSRQPGGKSVIVFMSNGDFGGVPQTLIRRLTAGAY